MLATAYSAAWRHACVRAACTLVEEGVGVNLVSWIASSPHFLPAPLVAFTLPFQTDGICFVVWTRRDRMMGFPAAGEDGEPGPGGPKGDKGDKGDKGAPGDARAMLAGSCL